MKVPGADLLAILASLVLTASAADDCHCLPGDACWPSLETWSSLNDTVDGRLIATIPIGSPCHDPDYDEVACAALQSSWFLPQLHFASSSSVMQPSFANQSCDPFTPRSQPCLLGNYVSFAVNVSSTDHVTAALAFAKKHNIRVVIRNTAHDMLGRSTGAGGLAIWTHNLRSIDFIDWSDPFYTGAAVKVGAGVLGYELVEAAHDQGKVVVLGECSTVGVAGGFLQGGGHSALSSSFGLAADNALEYEVVTAAGKVVKASRTTNADLYWALSGGGGGTYGVVFSVTLRAYPDAQIGGAKLQMAASSTTPELFAKAVSAFHDMLPAMTDKGALIIYIYYHGVFIVDSVTVYDSSADYVRDTVLAPFNDKLAELGVPASVSYTELPFRDHYDTYFGPIPFGHFEVEKYQFGSRMIPRKVLESNNDGIQAVLRNLTAQGVIIITDAGSYAAPEGVDGSVNSVNPVWRTSTIHAQLIVPWDSYSSPDSWTKAAAVRRKITDELEPQLMRLTPEGGAYFNEADFNQPDWQNAFFGKNYAKLLEIKHKWDPEDVFYVLKGVGSEAWTVADDGRMCRPEKPHVREL